MKTRLVVFVVLVRVLVLARDASDVEYGRLLPISAHGTPSYRTSPPGGTAFAVFVIFFRFGK